MQKMNFVSDLLRRFEKHFKTEGKTELQVRTTQLIHTSGFRWFEQFMSDAAGEFGVSKGELDEVRTKICVFPESYKYVLFGNPESIVFRPESQLEPLN